VAPALSCCAQIVGVEMATTCVFVRCRGTQKALPLLGRCCSKGQITCLSLACGWVVHIHCMSRGRASVLVFGVRDLGCDAAICQCLLRQSLPHSQQVCTWLHCLYLGITSRSLQAPAGAKHTVDAAPSHQHSYPFPATVRANIADSGQVLHNITTLQVE
jgi:hypothetical protein